MKFGTREAIADEIIAAQRDDGSWSLDDLGSWKRSNQSGDAYATGLMVYILSQADPSKHQNSIVRGREWLVKNQDAESGGWSAWSVNKKRSAESFVGQFMQDAATGYAVMALLATE